MTGVEQAPALVIPEADLCLDPLDKAGGGRFLCQLPRGHAERMHTDHRGTSWRFTDRGADTTPPTEQVKYFDRWRDLLNLTTLVAADLDDAWIAADAAADGDNDQKAEALPVLIEAVQAAVILLRGDDEPGGDDTEASDDTTPAGTR